MFDTTLFIQIVVTATIVLIIWKWYRILIKAFLLAIMMAFVLICIINYHEIFDWMEDQLSEKTQLTEDNSSYNVKIRNHFDESHTSPK